MSVHLHETGYDPDLDYNLLVVEHASAGPRRKTDAERVAERELNWAKELMDEDERCQNKSCPDIIKPESES